MVFEFFPTKQDRDIYKEAKRAFLAEDKRKDKLFESFNKLIEQNRLKLGLNKKSVKTKFFRTFSDVGEIFDIGENHICLKQEDEEFLTPVLITDEVRSHLKIQDKMFVTLGFYDGSWWVLDVVSIGSIIGGHHKKQERQIHFSINPLCMDVSL